VTIVSPARVPAPGTTTSAIIDRLAAQNGIRSPEFGKRIGTLVLAEPA